MARARRSPYLARFLSDFTLGFSDGLTVPFALTAGLSSLGEADTVIYAGLAELCAGSISMGIGGYLSAVDELPDSSPSDERSTGDEEEMRGMLHQREDADERTTDFSSSQYRSPQTDGSSRSSHSSSSSSMTGEKRDWDRQLICKHLEPLSLSAETLSQFLTSMQDQPGGFADAAKSLRLFHDTCPSSADSSPAFEQAQLPVMPVASGLSISLGYVVGGIIPLMPYFFAATVGAGLRWSIAFCLLALFLYGAGKSWILRDGDVKNYKKSIWSGVQMLILGALAAGAAVLCVNLVGGG